MIRVLKVVSVKPVCLPEERGIEIVNNISRQLPILAKQVNTVQSIEPVFTPYEAHVVLKFSSIPDASNQGIARETTVDLVLRLL
jgi:hypothetical protein